MSAPVLALLLALTGAAALALLLAVLLLRRRAGRLTRLLADHTNKLEQLQIQFGRFAPADVVERLTEGGGDVPPSRRQITLLFADLRGFTAMCDRLDPAQTVGILNGYFRCMTEVITGHHGRVTEVIGDELLALFGALQPNPWQAQDAVLAALDMRAELTRYNARLRADSLPELQFGIGIHRGEVLVGVMGNAELRKFGVVGDPINVASRVERLTRVHDVDLLISEEVRTALDARFRLRAMPPTQVRGKAEPIVTYLVEGLQPQPAAALG